MTTDPSRLRERNKRVHNARKKKNGCGLFFFRVSRLSLPLWKETLNLLGDLGRDILVQFGLLDRSSAEPSPYSSYSATVVTEVVHCVIIGQTPASTFLPLTDS